eukprot:5475217-Pyramimonas_sp.AAC.1
MVVAPIQQRSDNGCARGPAKCSQTQARYYYPRRWLTRECSMLLPTVCVASKLATSTVVSP